MDKVHSLMTFIAQFLKVVALIQKLLMQKKLLWKYSENLKPDRLAEISDPFPFDPPENVFRGIEREQKPQLTFFIFLNLSKATFESF